MLDIYRRPILHTLPLSAIEMQLPLNLYNLCKNKKSTFIVVTSKIKREQTINLFYLLALNNSESFFDSKQDFELEPNQK